MMKSSASDDLSDQGSSFLKMLQKMQTATKVIWA